MTNSDEHQVAVRRRSISASVRRHALAQSAFRCAFPNCGCPATLEDGTPVLEVAHIVAILSHGARHNPSLLSTDLNQADNLIVLCPTHHRLVDSSPEDYPANRLRSFKLKHSERVATALASQQPIKVAGSPQRRYSAAMEFWKRNRDENNEEVWHQFLTANPTIIALCIPGDIIQIGDKCYLGGKDWKNKGGSIVDFLMASQKTLNVTLVEIKTPRTKLVGPEYRTAMFSPSPELAGSVVQVWSYRDTLLKNFYLISKGAGQAFHPRCLLIAGDIEGERLGEDQTRSFELFRNGLQNTFIITFDELFAKVAATCEILDDLEQQTLD